MIETEYDGDTEEMGIDIHSIQRTKRTIKNFSLSTTFASRSSRSSSSLCSINSHILVEDLNWEEILGKKKLMNINDEY